MNTEYISKNFAHVFSSWCFFLYHGCSFLKSYFNEQLQSPSISDLNKLTALKIHSHQYTWYTFQQFGNTGIGSACIRVSASDCLYSLTGQGLWCSFSFGPSHEEKALLNAKFWVSKLLRIVIELQRIKQGNKLSHRMVFLWHSRKESFSLWKRIRGLHTTLVFDLFLKGS